MISRRLAEELRGGGLSPTAWTSHPLRVSAFGSAAPLPLPGEAMHLPVATFSVRLAQVSPAHSGERLANTNGESRKVDSFPLILCNKRSIRTVGVSINDG